VREIIEKQVRTTLSCFLRPASSYKLTVAGLFPARLLLHLRVARGQDGEPWRIANACPTCLNKVRTLPRLLPCISNETDFCLSFCLAQLAAEDHAARESCSRTSVSITERSSSIQTRRKSRRCHVSLASLCLELLHPLTLSCTLPADPSPLAARPRPWAKTVTLTTGERPLRTPARSARSASLGSLRPERHQSLR
jgi:hypothetical protein